MASARRQFTWKELARLNQRHNAHVAYKGKVYDVTGFLNRHPGGADQLMFGAGKDISQLFDSYHRSSTSELIRKKCKYVGDLVDSEVPTFPDRESDEFLITVRRRVADYFARRKIDPKINYLTFFQYFIFCVLAISFWVLALKAAASRSLSGWSLALPVGLLFAVVSGFFSAMVAMTIGHDGNHFAITHSPRVWKVVTSIAECIHGLSSLSWVYQHTLGHHVYTNMDEWDPDVVTVKGGKPDFWRIKPLQEWFPVYTYQHLYMPLLYSLLSIKMKVQDFHTLFIMQKASMRLNPPSFSQMGSFLAAKAAHILLRLVLPLYYLMPLLPLSSLLCLNLASEVAMGTWLAFITQLNHVNSDVKWPLVASENTPLSTNWSVLQLATTQDYATDSWFWNTFTGALNHQVSHHLCPGVLQCYYPLITPIVRQTCSEFGLKYNYVPTAWGALCSHLGHLKTMGSPVKPLH